MENIMEKNEKRDTYVCKRARMCKYLMDRGFTPYRVTPDWNAPKYDVYLFTATPELYAAVVDYVLQRNEERNGDKERSDAA